MKLAEFKLANGEKLPTLREFITAGLQNNQTTRLILEIKPSKGQHANYYRKKNYKLGL